MSGLSGESLPAWLAYWQGEASRLSWTQPWTELLSGSGPDAEWFVGATLNVAANCLERHLPRRRDDVAVHWEGEPGDRRTLTYGDLHSEACRLGAGLADLGVTPGERVAIHAGLVPEAVVAMLACARLGAVHVLIPQTLPPEALADRLERCGARILFTQDGAWRHGVVIPLKARADEAESSVSGIDHTIVIRRTGLDVDWFEGDHHYADVLARVSEPDEGWPAPAAFPAKHPLGGFLAPDPRGSTKLVLAGGAGMAVHASTFHRRALATGDDDPVWVAADIAWPLVQIHGVYGPLLSGSPTMLFEGMLDTPNGGRAWRIVDDYGITTLATTPSVVRRLRRWAAEGCPRSPASTIRHVSTAGEEIDADTQAWLRHGLGENVTVVSNVWGQLELCAMVIWDPPPNGPSSLPDPGWDIVDPTGASVPPGSEGEIVLRHPWPGRFVAVEPHQAEHGYWRHAPAYATFDLARREPDGRFTVLGRTDDLVKVSGQFVSLAAVASTLAAHPFVRDVEVGVLVRDDHIDVVAGVVMHSDVEAQEKTLQELIDHCDDTVGGLARPAVIVFVESFPDGLSPRLRREALQALIAVGWDPATTITAADLAAWNG